MGMDSRRRSAASSRRIASSSHSSKSASPEHEPARPPRPSMPSSRPRRPADADADTLLARNGSSRPKRKGKDKRADDDDAPMDLGAQEEPEEEQGVTRCICGKTGEDGDETGEFMVQCETCDVWQHGQCMGFPTEADLPPGEYHCELCRPDLHVERLEKHKTRAARLSRSHSPTTLLKPAKRRNTMNSRAADAYDESLKDIIEASALEATTGPAQQDGDSAPQAKKRKRTDDDAPPTKRTRSTSTASDRALLQREREQTPASTAVPSAPPRSMPPPAPPKPRNKRGGARKSTKIVETPPDAQDREQRSTTTTIGAGTGTGSTSTAGQRRTASARAKANGKRGNAGGAGTERARGGTRSAAQDAYEDASGHAGAGIGLPDHLAHLEPLFGPPPSASSSHPTNTAVTSNPSKTVPDEDTVRVRWPAKRMSVGDMNKRVRALVEWVGREQASLGERARRRNALVTALREVIGEGGGGKEEQTMRMMEELMSELIGFQERFGPGAKGRERRGAS